MGNNFRQVIVDNISCEELLLLEGYQVKKSGATRLKCAEHDSLVITPAEKCFTWNSRGVGGSVIDLYMVLHGCDAKKAMSELRKLLDREQRVQFTPAKKPEQPKQEKEKKQTALEPPAKCSDRTKWSRVYAYLIKTRRIDKEVCQWLAKEGVIYPDERGNICYIGRDKDGAINYAGIKGTITPTDGSKGYRHCCPGSDCDSRLVINRQAGNTRLVVTESLVDAMSFASMLHRHGLDYKKYTYLSLESADPAPVAKLLAESPQLATVYLAQDADDAGMLSRENCRELLQEAGLQPKLIDKIPTIGKDWNDTLKAVLEQAPAQYGVSLEITHTI